MIVAVIPNLFDRPRFGDKVTFVDSPQEAMALEPTMVIVDLDRCQDVSGFRLGGDVQVIGFGPHVDTDLHQEATDAGYTDVLPRSVFFKRLGELLDSAE